MLKRAYFCSAYLASWLVFGLGGLAAAAYCSLLLLRPRSGRSRAVRRVIRALFSIWVKWLRATGLVLVRWHGLPEGGLPDSTVYVANHPGLLDATFILARLPNACCIFKARLRHNLFLAPAAMAADYVAGDEGIDLVHEAGAQVAAGGTVLIFPEGTRTDRHQPLNPLKPGFYYIARRARAPIRPLAIRASGELLPRGLPWWRVPPFPVRIDIDCGPPIFPRPEQAAEDVVSEVRGRLLGCLHAPA